MKILRPLTEKEIELAAAHAAAYTRLTGIHEQARRALLVEHRAETKALRVELGVPDDEPMPGDPVTDDDKSDAPIGSLILPMLFSLLGGGYPSGPITQNPDPNPFAGPVNPPSDASPGVPVDVETGKPTVIPPPGVPAAPVIPPPGVPVASVGNAPAMPLSPRAPMPGTGTHPGCTVAHPCDKHGGAAAGVPSAAPGTLPSAPSGVPVLPTEPTHYDGRTMTDKTVVCTIFKPCKECVDRSRRPTTSPAGV